MERTLSQLWWEVRAYVQGCDSELHERLLAYAEGWLECMTFWGGDECSYMPGANEGEIDWEGKDCSNMHEDI